MDSFEFVQIPVAIVLGFAISEILAGWGHQLRHRHEQPFSGLQLLASGYVLMWALRYLWVQWSLRPEVWDYPAYLLSVAPAVLIALAAHSARFDPNPHQSDERSPYERTRQPVCGLLALLPLFLVLRIIYIAGPGNAPAVPGAVFVPVGFAIMTLIFVRLAISDRPLEQWVGWCINWALLLGFSAVMVPKLATV